MINPDAQRLLSTFPNTGNFSDITKADLGDGKFNVMTFPSNLGTSENRHFLSIAAIDKSRSRDSTKESETVMRNFYNFPLPTNITNSLTATWDSFAVEAVFGGKLALDAGSAIQRAGLNGAGGGSDFIRQTIERSVGTAKQLLGGDFSALQSAAGGAVDFGIGLGLRSLANAGPTTRALVGNTGLSTRNYAAQFFDGMQLREFGFSWDLYPKSYQESLELKRMEKSLKSDMSPSTSGANQFIIKFPTQFLLLFNTITTNGNVIENTYLPKIRPCVMTGVSFQFNSNGVNSFHYLEKSKEGEGAPPLSVAISMQFRETQFLYSEDFADGSVR